MILKKGFLLGSALSIVIILMAQTKSKPAPTKATIMAEGAKVYKQYCMACHQADAGGVPHLNPPLIKTPFILGDKKRLIQIVVNGKNDAVEIDGDVYTNPMPAQVLLTDQQIADVLSYVRNNFGNKASMVTLSEVKQVKAAKK
jgi:mono/diheme cytochrome c family protein